MKIVIFNKYQGQMYSQKYRNLTNQNLKSRSPIYQSQKYYNQMHQNLKNHNQMHYSYSLKMNYNLKCQILYLSMKYQDLLLKQNH